jgi:ribulose-phosphate 3-epimerase
MPDCHIAPSILSFDLGGLRDKLPELERAGASRIHFDVMDGQFVPPITFGSDFVKSLRSTCSTPFECHLMVETPERQFNAFAEAGCSTIVFHSEATRHAHRLIQSARDCGMRAGLAINPGTPVEFLLALADELDEALVMTVNPGWGAQHMVKSCLSKVERLRNAAPDLEIEVDGGIDPTTLPLARNAGANLFVVGSFIARAKSISCAMEELRAACG